MLLPISGSSTVNLGPFTQESLACKNDHKDGNKEWGMLAFPLEAGRLDLVLGENSNAAALKGRELWENKRNQKGKRTLIFFFSCLIFFFFSFSFSIFLGSQDGVPEVQLALK